MIDASREFKAMGCPCQVQLYGEVELVASALDAAEAEVLRLEKKYSRYRHDSLTARINETASSSLPLIVDEETAALLNFADQAFGQSSSLFDITSGVLRKVWDFRNGRPPQPSELNAVLKSVGWRRVAWNPPEILLEPGMELDFGGFVKEYAVDAVIKTCRELGIRYGLVDLGGDIGVIGPHPDGSPWMIGIQHPRRPDQAIGVIPLTKGCLASSGDYQRYFIREGRRYCHILNPQTGHPDVGFQAVSVCADQCVIAGLVSTVSMLKQPDQAMEWLQSLELTYLLVGMDGKVSSNTHY